MFVFLIFCVLNRLNKVLVDFGLIVLLEKFRGVGGVILIKLNTLRSPPRPHSWWRGLYVIFKIYSLQAASYLEIATL
jgi:hypothetical protein